MGEIWKDIVGFEGLYQVSNLGNVRSLEHITIGSNGKKRSFKGRILSINCKGNYPQCTLSMNGEYYQRLIHRLVAEAFIPNENNLPEVNHIDENPLNNRVDNLEWCEHKYNINYGTGNYRRCINNRNKSEYSKRIVQYDEDGVFVKEYPSLREMARQTGYDRKTIKGCCEGIYNQSHNYIWKYA